MEFIREIGIYQKESEKMIDSISINIDTAKLIEIFNVDLNDDPNVFKIYNIDKKQYLEISKLVPEILKFNFEDVEMFYECFQS